MLESKVFTQSRSCITFDFSHAINRLMKKSMEELIGLFLPEDTTENADRPHSANINLGANNKRSTIKALFWVVMSVIAALALGQLH